MNVDFYVAFEEKYRGSRDVIKSRLRVYQPFVEELRSLHQNLQVLDLGCGRGEWLELLREQGVVALGIDLDDQMLSDCRDRNLRVETAEALTWLADRPNESCDIVSAFHLVEHLPFASLDLLVRHSLRVLRTGGLLILETPNPENIVVGTTNFYLDPTHQRPLPPPLLAFLPEYHGFARVKIMRLQESAELAAGREPTLFDVLGGVSPDYAVIAQKQGGEDIMAPFDALWERDYGIKTDTLAMRYEQTHQQAMRNGLELARQAIEKSDMLFRQQQLLLEEQHQRLEAFYTSSSWRLTAPLRCLATHLRTIPFVLPNQARRTIRQLLLFGLLQTGRSPGLGRFLRNVVGHFPRFKAKIQCFVAQGSNETISTAASGNHHGNQVVPLTPAARRVYVDLKAAVEENMSKGIS